MTQIPTNKFSPTTKFVDLKGNNIQLLSKYSFSGFINIRILALSQNKIQTIQAGAFEDLGILSYLDLGENNLTTIDGDIWKGLYSLEILRLSGNPLHAVSSMNLSGNPLNAMSSTNFSHLPYLELVLADLAILESLHGELSNPTNYPNTPTQPKLGLEDDTDLTCDDTMCWLKRLDDKGLMEFYGTNGNLTRPQCQNESMSWAEYSATLDCQGNEHIIFREHMSFSWGH